MQEEKTVEELDKRGNKWHDIAVDAQEKLAQAKKTVRRLKHFLKMEDCLSRQRRILMETAKSEKEGLDRKMEAWRKRCVRLARQMSAMYFNNNLATHLR